MQIQLFRRLPLTCKLLGTLFYIYLLGIFEKNLMIDSSDKSIDFLWHSFLNGDDKSFALIYQRHIDRLLSYGYKLSTDKELVHDCLQDVFMDLFLRRKKVGVNIENLKAYLFVALRNCLIKKITKNRKSENIEITEGQAELFSNVEYCCQEQLIELEISNEIKNKLSTAVNSLPPKQKEVIYLKFEEELEYLEISEILKISVESARKLLYRALISLRKVVEPATFQILFLFLFKNK